MIVSASRTTAPNRARRPALFWTALLAGLILGGAPALAQDWGDDANDDWAAPQPAPAPAPRARPIRRPGDDLGWSARTGLGFTADPTTFLLNFEVPYAFESWFALGPMLQVGLDQNDALVMPTVNMTLKVPDLPGRDFDRVHPYGFAGIGLAYIEREVGNDDRDGTGFLVTAGFGVEYQVSERVYFGSQMMLNFLPKKTERESFIYSWQMGGIRFVF
ncbi:MAG: outer membrane beta-barrel protein [Myxococcota bacterium]